MSGVVGVLFYWLRRGDHPEVLARQPRGKLPVLGDAFTAKRAIAAIADAHGIALDRYTISLFDERTNHPLTSEEAIPTYAHIYASVDSIKLEDVGGGAAGGAGGEGAGGAGGSAVAAESATAEALMRAAAGVALAGLSGSRAEAEAARLRDAAPRLAMDRLAVISALRDMPLGLVPRRRSDEMAEVSPGQACPLCQSSVVAPAHTAECCRYRCCSACYRYAQDALMPDPVLCPLCGQRPPAASSAAAAPVLPLQPLSSSGAGKGASAVAGSSSGLPPIVAVKRQREDDDDDDDDGGRWPMHPSLPQSDATSTAVREAHASDTDSSFGSDDDDADDGIGY